MRCDKQWEVSSVFKLFERKNWQFQDNSNINRNIIHLVLPTFRSTCGHGSQYFICNKKLKINYLQAVYNLIEENFPKKPSCWRCCHLARFIIVSCTYLERHEELMNCWHNVEQHNCNYHCPTLSPKTKYQLDLVDCFQKRLSYIDRATQTWSGVRLPGWSLACWWSPFHPSPS